MYNSHLEEEKRRAWPCASATLNLDGLEQDRVSCRIGQHMHYTAPSSQYHGERRAWPCASAMLDLMGLNRMACVAGLARYRRMRATAAGSGPASAARTLPAISASRSGAANACRDQSSVMHLGMGAFRRGEAVARHILV